MYKVDNMTNKAEAQIKYKGYPLDKSCPFCGGDVVFTSNKELYGREYGNGKCYLCRGCKASVGTHPDGSPLGRLANKEMKALKRRAHSMFDPVWHNKKNKIKRSELYHRLADRLGIPVQDCHFGHFDVEQLNQAISIMKEENWFNKVPQK